MSVNAAGSLCDQSLPPMGESRWPYRLLVPAFWLRPRDVQRMALEQYVDRCAAQVCSCPNDVSICLLLAM